MRWFICFCLGIAATFCITLLWRRLRQLLRASLQGEAVIVTGCDSGLGFAISKRLLQEGAIVFATCLTPEGIQRCKELGSSMRPCRVDVTSDEDVKQLQRYVETELKKLDLKLRGPWLQQQAVKHASGPTVRAQMTGHFGSHQGGYRRGLVNNAGLGNYGFAEALDLKRFEALLQVNCLGTVRVTKAVLPMLRAYGPGARLVTMGSLSDRLPAGFGSAYVPTKAYVCSFTECVGAELQRFGVKTSVVEPGFIATGLLDSAQMGGSHASVNASDDVRQAYGDFRPMMAELRKPVMLFERLNGGMEMGGAWVADATVDALSSSWPRSRYLVGYETKLLMWLPRVPGWTRILAFFFERQHRNVHQ